MLPGEPEPINDRLSIEGVGEFFIPGLEPEDDTIDDVAPDDTGSADGSDGGGLDAGDLITPTSMDPAEAARSAAIVSLLATRADLEVDDLEVAELVVTEGPVYDLSEFDEAESILAFVDGLRRQRIRFALDRSGSIAVHRNDEARSDALIETLFGPEHGETDTTTMGDRDGHRGPDRDRGIVFADEVAPPLVSSPRRSSWILYGVLAVVAVVLLVIFVL